MFMEMMPRSPMMGAISPLSITLDSLPILAIRRNAKRSRDGDSGKLVANQQQRTVSFAKASLTPAKRLRWFST